jgi:mRNA-degrading endonuclease YafQ of YafQ-DinJ toxin-antitoxin module
MPGEEPYRAIQLTPRFLEALLSRDFTRTDQQSILRALARLDDDEHHPSLRVHKLSGQLSGTWSASASASLRIVFVRGRDGHKIIIGCSKHYDR